MTDPAYSSTGKVVFEKDGTAVDQHDEAVFGYIYDRPRIGALGTTADPAWYVFTGNGYDSDVGVAKLLMISLDGTHSVISVPTAAGSRGLSAPVLLSSDTTDLMVETVFAGDLNGDLWMFRINKASPASSTAVKVYDRQSRPADHREPPPSRQYPSNNRQLPGLFRHRQHPQRGRCPGRRPPVQSINAVYIPASWIDGTVTTPTPIIATDLESQDLDTNTLTAFSQDLRVMSTHNAVDFVCPDSTQDPCTTDLKGWKLTFPDCGQRLVGTPFVRAGRVQFVTSNPTGTLACNNTTTTLSGDSWVMSLDYLTGSDGNTVVYNLNGDGELTDSDKVDDKFPVALSLGSGNIAQPAFVRLTTAVSTRCTSTASCCRFR